ncbi:MAG TPA: sugar phosphate isomerase/epimerase [Candidatus Merdivicinus intestinavium]|nr:sugar phosphate isomerase/epimerase [Candidatus Merdivicinus intestinavium]
MERMKTGLTSVTFRQKAPEEIIRLAAEAGLDGIEWGGDVHVPAGDAGTAAEIGRRTREAGLSVLSYGSYFRADEGEDFAPVLASAKALGAPLIRIWAGRKTYEQSGPEEFSALASRIREAAEAAGREGVRIAFEYHRGTATQTAAGALALLKAAGSGNAGCYWQPNPDISKEEQLSEIDALLPYLANIHVFAWTGANVRHPLEEGRDVWEEYLSRIRRAPGSRALILEFVKDDSEDAFRADAAALKEWTARLGL